MQNTLPYPTDLTGEQWAILETMLPQRKKLGRPRSDAQRVLGAVFYLLRTGCAWRMLPHDFPHWRTVYGHFRQWARSGRLEMMLHALRTVDRVEDARNATPSAAIIDSQSIRSAEGGEQRGYDAVKKITGRKRHLLVDTRGTLIALQVGSASVQDRQAALPLIRRAATLHRRLRLVWADGGYAGALVHHVAQLRKHRRLHLQIVKRPQIHRFTPLPKRWLVERTIAWLMKFRRLRADYERLVAHSTAMIFLAMIHILVSRLA